MGLQKEIKMIMQVFAKFAYLFTTRQLCKISKVKIGSNFQRCGFEALYEENPIIYSERFRIVVRCRRPTEEFDRRELSIIVINNI